LWKVEQQHAFCTLFTKLPDLEAEVENWLNGHRNNGIFVSTKMIIFEAAWYLMVLGQLLGITRFMKGHELLNKR
jgi:hypothetical protein